VACAPKHLAPTDTRNKVAVLAPHWIHNFAFLENANPVNDLGVLGTLGNSWPALSGTTLAPANGAWASADTEHAPYWEYNPTSSRLLLPLPASAADLVRGTLLLRWRDIGGLATYAPAIYYCNRIGDPASVPKALGIYRVAGENVLRIALNVGGTKHEITFSNYGWDQWHVLLVSWGPRGLSTPSYPCGRWHTRGQPKWSRAIS
jgi:hypothetical protein